MPLDHRMQHQDAEIGASQRSIRVIQLYAVERVSAGRSAGIAAEPRHCQAQPAYGHAHRQDAVRLGEVVEPAQLGIDALGRVATMLGALPRRIVIATDGEGMDTGVTEPGELRGDELALQVARLGAVEEVTRLDEEVRLPRDRLVHDAREGLAQPRTALA